MSHTPEPWRHMGYGGIAVCGSSDIYDGPVWATIVHCRDTSHTYSDGQTWSAAGDKDANARRIVAAINATAGIPTEALEADGIGRLQHMASQLAACLDSARMIMDEEARNLAGSIVEDARTLLAEIGGGEPEPWDMGDPHEGDGL